jgi:large subunit ribosomal protein L35
MPKLKTKKGLVKRFKITARGKVRRQRACRGHLLAKKRRKTKRSLKRPALVSKTDKKAIKGLLWR